MTSIKDLMSPKWHQHFSDNYFVAANQFTAIFGLIPPLLQFSVYFWPKNALAKYFHNVLKNCSNEIPSYEIWENSDLFCVKKTLKYQNSHCSTKHKDLFGAEPHIVHKNADYLPWFWPKNCINEINNPKNAFLQCFETFSQQPNFE